MDPHSIVVVSLHTPKEKIWGELLAISTAGITVRGVDLNSFDHFIRQINEPEGERVGVPTLFFPMTRVERITLDEPTGAILAFEKQVAWWLPIIVLSRDILILVVAVVIILISGYRPFPPSIFGKLTTFFQIILVFSVVLGAAYPNAFVAGINRPLAYVVATLSVFSGFHYSVTIARGLSSGTPAGSTSR